MSAPSPSSESALTPRRPVAEVWSIAWPTVLTMTSYTVMQFIDKLMVGQVGPLEVAAQGNGGIWAFTPIAVAMGFLTVVNTYVSQNLGAGTPRNGPRYAWAALWISLAFWLDDPPARGLRTAVGLRGHARSRRGRQRRAAHRARDGVRAHPAARRDRHAGRAEHASLLLRAASARW